MIKLLIAGQTLSVVTQKVVSGTHDYLEVEGSFRTPDWNNMRKWVHFHQGNYDFILPMHNDRIEATQHLDLTEGTWDVYVHGNYADDSEVTERITTDVKYLWVEGPHDGHPFPPLTPDVSEMLANEIEEAIDTAQSVRDDADAGEFDGATFTPSVDEEGNISWTNDQGKPNPETQNIRGPKGNTGDSGVHVGTEAPTDPAKNVWINPEGMPGKVVTSFALVSGTHQPGTFDTYLMTFSDGTQLSMPIYNGADGTGIGDMLKNVYDTQNKATDVFSYADTKAAAATAAAKDKTTVTGILKGNGTAVSAAVAGTDYQEPLEPGVDYQTPLTIDSAMSGSSTNPVQNKIIKEYIDQNSGKLFFATYESTPFSEIKAAVNSGKIPVVKNANWYYRYSSMYNKTNPGGTVTEIISFECIYFNGSSFYPQWMTVDEDENWSYNTSMSEILTGNDKENAVTSGSSKVPTSGAVYNAIQGSRITVDNALSSTSTNAVQNRVIKSALDGKASTSQIPTSLKNPYALSITANGTTTTYDGSAARSISISGGGSEIVTDVFTTTLGITLSSGAGVQMLVPISKTGYTALGVVQIDFPDYYYADKPDILVGSYFISGSNVSLSIRNISNMNITPSNRISVTVLFKKN